MTTSCPLVSIGLPVYNGARFLPRALDSLLAQDYPNFELIVSDNASTDDTRAVCERYAGRDGRVRFSRTERNAGAISNFLRVLDQARGDYFMWAACDDHWSPSFISALRRELDARRDCDVAMCAIECVHGDYSHLEYLRFGAEDGRPPNTLSSFELFKAMQYGGQHYLYLYGLFRTPFLRKAMRDPWPDVPSGDVYFMAELALATRFGYVDEVLHTRTVHAKPAYQRFTDEGFARLLHQGLWAKPDELRALKQRVRRSRIVPWRCKVAALVWLRLSSLNLRRFPGGSLIHRLNRAVARKLG